jgi:hypothetical protein
MKNLYIFYNSSALEEEKIILGENYNQKEGDKLFQGLYNNQEKTLLHSEYFIFVLCKELCTEF